MVGLPGYAISTPFEVIEVAPLPLATSAKAKLFVLTWDCIRAMGKIADIYTDSIYVF